MCPTYNYMAKPTYNFEISGRKDFILSSPRRIKKSPTTKVVGDICFAYASTAV